ncbi:MAG: 2Fe-2S iron-sulfur cluster-binding protein [Alphaproteobacteria bacterium]
MTYAVRLLTFDEEIEVAEDETILEIAMEENIPYPYGCASGNCGACKSRLVLGEVEMRTHSTFALTEEERERGLVLACRAEPRSDCTLAVLNYDDSLAHPLKRLGGEVCAVEKLTHDIVSIRIQLSEPMAYTAGQFASVAFPGLAARDYSFAAPPSEDGQVEFHIRRMGDGAVSAFIFDELAVGEPVAVHGPMGFAFLREKETGPIFAVAGGSGLAPIRAILQSALTAEDSDGRPVRLWFGARDEVDVYLEDELKALPGLEMSVVLSEPTGETKRRSGFVTTALEEDLKALGAQALDGARAYLAGPPVMVEAAIEIFRAAGLDQSRIHADAFYTEADKAALT